MRSSRRRAIAEACLALAQHPRSATKGARFVQQFAELHPAAVGGDVGAAEACPEPAKGWSLNR